MNLRKNLKNIKMGLVLAGLVLGMGVGMNVDVSEGFEASQCSDGIDNDGDGLIDDDDPDCISTDGDDYSSALNHHGGFHNADNYPNRYAFAALKSDGSITAWGYSDWGVSGAPSGTGYTKIYSTYGAFAALKSDGSITAWGHSDAGGSGAPSDAGYTKIYSTVYAFAALKSDGSITVWGDSGFGGSGAPSGTGYTKIYSTYGAFAALKPDGSITAWGHSDRGGAGAPSGTGYTISYGETNDGVTEGNNQSSQCSDGIDNDGDGLIDMDDPGCHTDFNADNNDSYDSHIDSENNYFIERVSVSSDGSEANSGTDYPSISADGRYIAFSSYASNLVANDTNGYRDIFVHDRTTGETTRVNVSSDGLEANESRGFLMIDYSSISADGRYVAFGSYASNLVANDTNGNYDIFVHDRITGETTRVSVSSDGSEANSGTDWTDYPSYPSISADGRYVAFGSSASNLVANDTNGNYDIFVHDRITGETTRVSVSSDGSEANGWADYPSISTDGRYVVFNSYASNLVVNDTNGNHDIFVHDRITEETTRVSVSSDGSEANSWASCYLSSISTDGRYVVFSSYASNLVANDTNGNHDIFVHDRITGETTRVSVSSDGSEANSGAGYPSISADGRYVAFSSYASNLVANDTNGNHDIFVHDRITGETTRVSVSSDGSEANSWAGYPSISADGRYIAFVASNLVANDTNGYGNIFVTKNPLYDGVITTPVNEAPVITLLGDNPLTLDYGEEYAEPGATAYDEEDRDISASIEITGEENIDINTPGTYYVTYSVTDSQGATTEEIRTIEMGEEPENIPPVLSYSTEEGYDDGLNDQFNTSRGSHPDRATANEDEITFKVLYQDEEAPMHVYASIYDHYGFSGYFYDNDISFPVEDDDELEFRTAEDLDLPYFEETLVGYDGGWLVDGKEGFDKGDSTTITFSSDEVFETITTLVARKVGFTAGDMFAEFTLETLGADGTPIVSINDRIEFTEEEDEFKEIVLSLEANDSNIKHLRLSVTSGSDVELWIRSIDAFNKNIQLNPEENSDIDFTAGVEYSATSTFPKGEYNFYFLATDENSQKTRLPEEGVEYFKTGYSSVALLPGIKASWLKGAVSETSVDLWPAILMPIETMHLNNGVSIRDNIFTDDIIKQFNGVDRAYDVFSDFMDSSLVGNKIISEWKALPYDWRLPFEDIVINGEVEIDADENERVYYSRSDDVSDPYIVSEINRLADSSPTGKVTIIGHSMGGMIAKYLLQRAEAQADPLYDKIDSLILVASPQLGTPEAIGALLHGDGKGQDIFWIINPVQSRFFGEEMQSSYNLLTSSKYFDSNQAVPVTFHSSVSIIPEMSTLAGTKITSYDKLSQFLSGNPLLSGDLSWEDPEANELDTPNVLRTTLLNNAVDTHSLIDGWHNEEISDDIKVIQIVGTGLQTLNGILYTCWSDDCMESQNITDLERYPDMKENGDGVVVSSSAAAMEFSDTYYVDLPGYAYAQESDSVISYDHGLIMSAAPVMKLILRSVGGTLDENKLPVFTSTEVTSSGEKYYEGRMESPVDVHVYDSHGRHTGITQRSLDNTETQSYEEQIPNSYYMEFGGHKYVGFGSRDAHSIMLDGYDLGTFTFTITETVNDEIVGEKMFKNIPVSETTIGVIVVDNGVESLMLDVDGDEVIDHEVSAGEGPDAEQSLSILASVVSSMELHNGTKKSILAKIYAAEQSFEKENKNAMRGQFDALINHIEAQAGKHIQQEDAEKLIEIVQTIQKWIEE